MQKKTRSEKARAKNEERATARRSLFTKAGFAKRLWLSKTATACWHAFTPTLELACSSGLNLLIS